MNRGKDMNILYRGVKDEMSVNEFHNKSNAQGQNYFKNEKAYIFGGYTSIEWKSSGAQVLAPESFLFTLTNMYNI